MVAKHTAYSTYIHTIHTSKDTHKKRKVKKVFKVRKLRTTCYLSKQVILLFPDRQTPSRSEQNDTQQHSNNAVKK